MDPIVTERLRATSNYRISALQAAEEHVDGKPKT